MIKDSLEMDKLIFGWTRLPTVFEIHFKPCLANDESSFINLSVIVCSDDKPLCFFDLVMFVKSVDYL